QPGHRRDHGEDVLLQLLVAGPAPGHVAAVVTGDELQLAAAHAPGPVDVLHRRVEVLLLHAGDGRAEAPGGRRHVDRPEPDRVGRDADVGGVVGLLPRGAGGGGGAGRRRRGVVAGRAVGRRRPGRGLRAVRGRRRPRGRSRGGRRGPRRRRRAVRGRRRGGAGIGGAGRGAVVGAGRGGAARGCGRGGGRRRLVVRLRR